MEGTKGMCSESLRVAEPFLRILTKSNVLQGVFIIDAICVIAREMGGESWNHFHTLARSAVYDWANLVSLACSSIGHGSSSTNAHFPSATEGVVEVCNIYETTVFLLGKVTKSREALEMFDTEKGARFPIVTKLLRMGTGDGMGLAQNVNPNPNPSGNGSGEKTDGLGHEPDSGHGHGHGHGHGKKTDGHGHGHEPDSAANAHGPAKMRVSQQNLQHSWDVSQRSTREDWDEWMRR